MIKKTIYKITGTVLQLVSWKCYFRITLTAELFNVLSLVYIKMLQFEIALSNNQLRYVKYYYILFVCDMYCE